MATPQQVVSRLQTLAAGRPPDTIARFCLNNGYFGTINDDSDSPLVNYLIAQGVPETVGDRIRGFQYFGVDGSILYIPREIGVFLTLFNRGYYPLIVKP